MIRYQCDVCKREMSPHELRYVVQIEISQAFEPLNDDEPSDDRDYLDEIHDMLETMDDSAADDIFQQIRLDLCPHCRQKFARQIRSRETSPEVHFSEN